MGGVPLYWGTLSVGEHGGRVVFQNFLSFRVLGMINAFLFEC
jgi:hypothetical protein